jgi:hypothetical protein
MTENAAVRGCADSLAATLEEHPEPQPAPELAAAKPSLGTAWRLLDEARAKLQAVRDVCEGASTGNLANTPRGRLAKAVLSQLGES